MVFPGWNLDLAITSIRGQIERSTNRECARQPTSGNVRDAAFNNATTHTALTPANYGAGDEIAMVTMMPKQLPAAILLREMFRYLIAFAARRSQRPIWKDIFTPELPSARR